MDDHNARVPTIATAAAEQVALRAAASEAIGHLGQGVGLFARLRMPCEEARTRSEGTLI